MSSSAPASPAPAAPAANPPPVRLSSTKRTVLALVALGVGAWLAQFGYHLWKYEETDDAYAVGHVHQVSSEVDGQVAAVLAVENQAVRAGDVLVRLDPLESDTSGRKGRPRPRPRRKPRRPRPSPPWPRPMRS